jgi:hypothetical protein
MCAYQSEIASPAVVNSNHGMSFILLTLPKTVRMNEMSQQQQQII